MNYTTHTTTMAIPTETKIFVAVAQKIREMKEQDSSIKYRHHYLENGEVVIEYTKGA